MLRFVKWLFKSEGAYKFWGGLRDYLLYCVFWLNIVAVGVTSLFPGLMLFGFQLKTLEYAGYVLAYSTFFSSLGVFAMMIPKEQYSPFFGWYLVFGYVGGIASTVILVVALVGSRLVLAPIQAASFVAAGALIIAIVVGTVATIKSYS